MATTVEKLILLIEDVGVDKAEKAFGKAKKKIEETGKAAENTSNQVKKTGFAFKQFRGASSALTNTTGQLSVQVQDVAVQLESGTDAVRVFAQQGPQIAAIFGPQGALFGALLAVGALVAGPFVRSFFAANEAIESTDKRIREFTGSLNDLSEVEKTLKLTQVAQELRDTEKQIRDLTEAQADSLERFRELRSGNVGFIDSLGEIFSGYSSLEEAQRGSTAELAKTNAALEEAKDKYKELTEQAEILTGVSEEEDEATKKKRETLEAYLLSLEEQYATLGMNTVQLGVYKAMQNGATVSEINATRAILEKIEAYKEAEKAAKEAAKAEAKRKAEEEREQERRERQAENFQKRLNKKRFELIVQAREDQIKADEEAAEQEEIRQQERNERVFAEQKRHMERVFADYKKKEEERIESARIVNEGLLSLEDKLMKGKTEKQKAGFRTLVNVMNQEKRERAINIVSTSYDAAMKAYAALAGIPIVGPALGAGAAAAVITAGVSFAAQSLAGRAVGGQVRAGESYVVGERGPEVLTMGSSGRVIPNERIGSSGQQPVNKTANVTFNINANDAKGFDTLLQQRRGLIVSIINSALNDRGRPAIV